METRINRYDVWQNKLFEIIQINHPYKLQGDESEMNELRAFISLKGEQAKVHYDSLIDQGVNPYEANEDTINEVLMPGLKFSPTDYLASFLWNEYQIEADQEKRINLYFHTKDIFEQNQIGDSIYEDTEKEQKLLEDLTSFFKKHPDMVS